MELEKKSGERRGDQMTEELIEYCQAKADLGPLIYKPFLLLFWLYPDQSRSSLNPSLDFWHIITLVCILLS